MNNIRFCSHLAEFFLEWEMLKENLYKKSKHIYVNPPPPPTPENRVVYEIMWKNIVEPGNVIGRMRIACWIPKATNTHSEYVTLVAFTLWHLLHERAWVLTF